MIRHANDAAARHKFEIRVGHARVTVEAATRQQALAEGRRRLADDMPRMWDKIYSLADEQFEIEEKQ